MEMWGMLLLTWLLVEIGFYLYIHLYLLPSLQTTSKNYKYAIDNPVTATEKFCQLLHTLDTYSPGSFLSGWCLNSIPSKKPVNTDQVDSWLAWVAFNSTLSELSAEQVETVCSLRAKYFVGATTDQSSSREMAPKFNMVPIPHVHHPLILYALFHACVQWGEWTLYSKGYHFLQTNDGMTYWYRQGFPSRDTPPTPVFIIHGINSMGWSQYATLVDAFGDHRTLVLINYDAIKPCTLCVDVMPPEVFQRNIVEIMERHHIPQCSIVGHSWGTFLTRWVLQHIPERIVHVTLIDPVALTIYFPDTVHTMFYKPSRTIQDYLLRYFLTYDITIAYNLQRHFEWHNTVIYLEDVPDHIGLVIGIAMQDEFLYSRGAVELVEKCAAARKASSHASPIRHLIWERYGHADAIYDREAMRNIVKAIEANEIGKSTDVRRTIVD